MFRYDCLMWFVKHCLLKIKSLVSGIWILVQVGVGPDVLTACTVVNLIFDSEDDYCKLLVVEIAVVIFYLFMTRLLGSHLFFCIKILIQLTWYHSTDMIQLTFTLNMTTTQVVKCQSQSTTVLFRSTAQPTMKWLLDSNLLPFYIIQTATLLWCT